MERLVLNKKGASVLSLELGTPVAGLFLYIRTAQRYGCHGASLSWRRDMFRKLRELADKAAVRVTTTSKAVGDTIPDPTVVLESLKSAVPTSGRIARAYHQTFHFLLVGDRIGMVHYASDENIRIVILDLAWLHQLAAVGDVISDNEWQQHAERAEIALAAIVDENVRVPQASVIRSATGAQAWDKLRTACDAVITIAAAGMSQSSVSAGASAGAFFVPTEIGRKIVYDKLKEFLGK